MSGTVEGLTAAGLVLELDGSVDLAVPAGAKGFSFPSPTLDGAEYHLLVKTQPAGQTCGVEPWEGRTPVRNVRVSCDAEAHLVGGTVGGLATAESVVLTLNGAAYTVGQNGPFQFPVAVPYRLTYGVAVKIAPAGKGCLLESASGTMNHADVASVTVTCTAAPDRPVLAVTGSLKRLHFTWETAVRATRYRFYEDPNGSGFVQRGGELAATAYDLDLAVHRHDWLHARYRVEACNPNGCTSSADIRSGVMLDTIGLLLASNGGAGDSFGWAVAMSADGSTLAVGAPEENGNAGGEGDAGAVYVFVRSGSE